MRYKISNKEITGPFTIPSGIVATEVSTLGKIAKEIPEIGILTTKSIGPEPKKGNKEPILAQVTPFSFINAVGLTNPGAEKFARKISKIVFYYRKNWRFGNRQIGRSYKKRKARLLFKLRAGTNGQKSYSN